MFSHVRPDPARGFFNLANPAYAAAMHDPLPYTRLQSGTAPAFSTDGRTLFYLRGAGLAQIWETSLDDGAHRPLTAHDERVSQVRRAPHDDRLVYAIDAGGDERHQLWLLDNGAARPLTAAPDTFHGCGAWTPDGARIAFTANDRDAAHFDVLTIDVATGVCERLMHGTHEAAIGAWSKDGASVIVVQDRSTGDQRAFVLAAEGTSTPVPRAGATRYGSLRWDDGALMGLTNAGGREFMALARIDPVTGHAEPVFAPADRDVEAWSLSSAGVLATIENDRGYSVLRVGPRDTDRAAVEGLPPGLGADLAWSPGGERLAFSFTAPTLPPGLWLWEDGAIRPLWQPDCPLPVRDFALVEWTSFDGRPIPGWFATPPGPAPASGWPAVVWVHGGPAAQTRANFRADMQALLHQGYAVLMPNVRGSTGYGRACMDADDVERRLDSVHDLAAGHAWLIRQPGIDPARIAVVGQSYGGYMVLAAITEYPALWRCAIDFYGIADYATLLDATGPWRKAHRAAEYGDPIRHRALFDRISPIRHIGRVQAPLLVLHGKRDPRVAIGESEQIVAALRARNATVIYEVFDYAGHGFVRPDDKARVSQAVAGFLARFL